MKGIILAGGAGSRLWPMTLPISKQLLPVYDKPMVYYALNTLMQAGIQDIIIVATPNDTPRYQQLLGDGARWGITLDYTIQQHPGGIAEAIVICAEKIADQSICLILGDNLMIGPQIDTICRNAAQKIVQQHGAQIFLAQVNNPAIYGVVKYDGDRIADILEKPATPPSNDVVIGLYMYGPDVVDRAKTLKPSRRGELEITDLNRMYLQDNTLSHSKLNTGTVWLDMGTPDSLQDAAAFIATIYHRQGIKIGCVEQTAWNNGWIDDDALRNLAAAMEKSEYGQYLRSLLE